MAGLVFLFAVFGILSGLQLSVETEDEENLKLEMPDTDDHCEIQILDDLCRSVSFYSSINIVRLIMHPKNCYVPCDSELKVCGIIMCLSETKGNSEDFGFGSQTSVGDIYKKPVLFEDKTCVCNTNEIELLVTQEGKEVSNKHFVEYRVQEITDSDCKAAVCYWKLTVFTRLPSEYGGNPDLTGCINKNICMVVCHIRNSILLQDSGDYTLLTIMAFTSALSFILTVTFKNYTKMGRALFKVKDKDMGTKTPQRTQHPSSSESSVDNSEDNFPTDQEDAGVDENAMYMHDRALQELFSAVSDADSMTYEAFRRQALMRDRSQEREPDHLKHRLRI